MGHKNREQAQAQGQYNAALTTAQTETPYEAKRRQFAEGITDWAQGGDYTNPTGAAKVFYNMADPAERKARMAVLDNTRGQGVSALGAGANPTLLALDKQHQDDVAERDAAQNYQDTTSNLVSGAYGMLGDLQNSAQARNLSILNTTAGRFGQERQITASRPKWWQVLLSLGDRASKGFGGGSSGGDS
ncbi:MAG: hypothetical protein M3348_17575 [Acidobacteriota bacterium]|nr:hypothetical protein [Acidobacteriota bacterium]